MKLTILFIVCIITAFIFSDAAANYSVLTSMAPSHSGGTDKCGCHYNRKSGKYHCHTRKQKGGDCPT